MHLCRKNCIFISFYASNMSIAILRTLPRCGSFKAATAPLCLAPQRMAFWWICNSRNSLGMPTGKLRERMLHEREKTAQELAKFKIIFKKSVRRHLQHTAAWQEMSILMHTISAEWWVIVVANVTHWQTEGYKIRRISLTRNIYYFASSSHINGGAITY